MVKSGFQGTRGPSEIAQEIVSVFESHEWHRLETLYHPDARIETSLLKGQVLTAQETIAVVQQAVKAGEAYPPSFWIIEDIDEHAALAVGAMARSHRTGLRHGLVCWLSTYVDGLLYRSAPYPTEREALEAYREIGLDLGMPSVTLPARRA